MQKVRDDDPGDEDGRVDDRWWYPRSCGEVFGAVRATIFDDAGAFCPDGFIGDAESFEGSDTAVGTDRLCADVLDVVADFADGCVDSAEGDRHIFQTHAHDACAPGVIVVFMRIRLSVTRAGAGLSGDGRGDGEAGDEDGEEVGAGVEVHAGARDGVFVDGRFDAADEEGVEAVGAYGEAAADRGEV